MTPPASRVNSADLDPTTDDLQQLLNILPDPLRHRLVDHPRKHELIEIILDLGRRPEARFPGDAEYLSEDVVTKDDLLQCVNQVGHFGGDNRGGLERTLHRISAIRNRSGEIIGLTCRVGRAVFGTVGMIRDLVEKGQSILMLGRPGVGKTTALREIARVLADDLLKRVVIIDTSNEIAGDGDVPHPAIGRARRMQVAHPDQQHQVMIEAVENHTPEVIVIDEIGTELEALAARTIAERGVQLIGTAHGNQLENLLKNPTLSDLVGGIQTVTLGDDEARRRRTQKSVLERKAPPTFEVAIEMTERQRWVVHENVAETIDNLLRGRQPGAQVRTTDANGQVQITETQPEPPPMLASKRQGWRASGQMTPLAAVPKRTLRAVPTTEEQRFESLLDDTLGDDALPSELLAQAEGLEPAFGPNGEELTLVYPYGISRDPLAHVISTLDLPVRMTKDLDQAQAVLALRSHLKNHAKLKQLARSRQIPIYTVKANSIPQITRSLRRLLELDDGAQPDNIKLELFSRSSDDDELEALEEARLAVEQIVIPKGQPVELLPRSAKIRKMQHELAEHYRLKSLSFGDEPNRRLRIYPA
ncbi:MAG: R3H domain-containing nucleic acid-binding protein [Cyanobacteria bacterium J06628_6]